MRGEKFSGATEAWQSLQYKNLRRRPSGVSSLTCWGVVETHEQWVGLRLRRTSASGKLVKAHFSPHVADFVVNSRVKVTGFQRLVWFFLLLSCSLASCVGEAGPRLLSGHALFT